MNTQRSGIDEAGTDRDGRRLEEITEGMSGDRTILSPYLIPPLFIPSSRRFFHLDSFVLSSVQDIFAERFVYLRYPLLQAITLSDIVGL